MALSETRWEMCWFVQYLSLCGAIFKYIQKQRDKYSELPYTCHPDGTIPEILFLFFSFPFLFSLLTCFKANARHHSTSLLHTSDCMPLTCGCFLRQPQGSVRTLPNAGIPSSTMPLTIKFPHRLFLELVCLNEDPAKVCTWQLVILFLCLF